MPTYLAAMSEAIASSAARWPDLFQYGENILQGSRLCGMARHLRGHVVNVGNCENTHVGAGLGAMAAGGRAALFMKQLDFLLLAADQLVNTTAFLRASAEPVTGSFTIFVIVCDQGMQGPQSSFGAFADLCSMARADGYTLTNRREAERVLAAQLGAPGFRMIALSQRLFGDEVIDEPVEWAAEDGSVFQYRRGDTATVVSFGFAFPQALQAAGEFGSASLFTIHPALPHRWGRVAEDAARTGRLVVADDGKGTSSLGHKLINQVRERAPACQVTLYTREEAIETRVSADRFALTGAAA